MKKVCSHLNALDFNLTSHRTGKYTDFHLYTQKQAEWRQQEDYGGSFSILTQGEDYKSPTTN